MRSIFLIKEHVMSDHSTFQIVTEQLFQMHLAEEDGTNAYITQKDIARRFRRTVEGCAKRRGELFVSEVNIVTEPFSPLAKESVVRIAKKHGYQAECDNRAYKLKYLGSDRGGHYSTDYYHYLQYGYILVTLPKK